MAMTTISGSTSALGSLVSLYASENAANSAKSDSTLNTGQVDSLVSMIDGGSTSSSTGLDALLGGSTTTTPTDLSSILDEIEAQKSAAATKSDDTTSSTATSAQQKAASLMQSVYQTQQSNLFTLIG